jgi:hypothetical protein
MRRSRGAVSLEIVESLEKSSCAVSAAFRVLDGHLVKVGSAADGGQNEVNELAVFGKKAFRDCLHVVRVAFDDLEVWG